MFDDASVLGGGDLFEDEDADEHGQSDDARHELEQRREHEIVGSDPPEAPADLKWQWPWYNTLLHRRLIHAVWGIRDGLTRGCFLD